MLTSALSGRTGGWSDYSSDLYYEKTGGLYDRISDTEYIDFCVRISTVGRWKEYSENM